MNERTAVYRLLDTSRVLLYVGLSRNPERRWLQHAKTKPWWPNVDERLVDWHPSREAAQVAEAEAIQQEGPLYNIALPDPADPMTWPAPIWLEHQAEAVRRRLATRASLGLCPDCHAPLPPPKTCANEKCGGTFYRGENGRRDAKYCSLRCANADRIRKWRQRQKQESA